MPPASCAGSLPSGTRFTISGPRTPGRHLVHPLKAHPTQVSRSPATAPRVSPPPDRLTDVGLLLLTLIWGVNFSVVKAALQWVGPMAFNALRFPLAALTVFLILRLRGPLPRPERRHLIPLLLLGFLGNGVYQVLFIHALDLTRAGNVALLLATTPVWTALLAALFRENTLDGATVLGGIATLGGMTLVVVGGSGGPGWGGGTFRGDLLAAGAAFTWALYTVASRGLIVRYGSVPVTAWTLWGGTAAIVVLGLPELGKTELWTLPPSVWGAVVFAGVLALGLSYVLWYRGVQRLGSARTATYSNLVPVVALLTAWATLGEVPVALQWMGAVIILGGVVLARFGGRLRFRSLRPRA
jgi:drug/metabolite transporter (DMT)-like permease